MADGQLVPDSVTIEMLEEEVIKNPDSKGFIFDGFPRTVPQAEALDQFLDKKHQKIDVVLQLDVNENELKERIAERSRLGGRADDAAEKLIMRMDEYFTKTIHVIPYYERKKLVTKIDGIGLIDEIFHKLCTAIDPLV